MKHKVKVEVDGKIVWQGECEDGASVMLADYSSYKSSADVGEYVIVDYSADDRVLGVELLMSRKDFLTAVAEARENGLTDETIKVDDEPRDESGYPGIQGLEAIARRRREAR